MDTPTPTTGLWITDPQAYRQKLFDLLGDRDPMEVMSETANSLTRIVEKQTREIMQLRPFEGKWTPTEIIGHLIDAEWIYGYRLRLILSEDTPTILGMDQDLWVAAQRHNEREPSELVDMFRSMRLCDLPLWKQLRPADLNRAGRHNERGDETLGDMLRMMPGHDLWHIDQIRRYLQATKSAS